MHRAERLAARLALEVAHENVEIDGEDVRDRNEAEPRERLLVALVDLDGETRDALLAQLLRELAQRLGRLVVEAAEVRRAVADLHR